MDTFIYNTNSLTDEICDEIIDKFQKSYNNNKMNNIIKKCLNKENEIKIKFNILENDIWFNIKNILIFELNKHLELYYSKLNNDIFFFNNIQKTKTIQEFIIKGYNNNSNNTFNSDTYIINKSLKKMRLMNFIWYLDAITTDNENNIIQILDYKIIPKKGDILIFPCDWFFPYSEKFLNSTTNYMITGSIFIDI